MHPDTHGKSWFDSLIAWDAFEQLYQLLAEHERAEAAQTMMAALDYAVMEAVLHHLHQDHHHDFLELCQTKYHEPTLLFWLEERATGVTERVRDTITSTYQEFYIALSE